MGAIQSHTSGNASSVSQHAAWRALEAALDGGEGREPITRMQAAFRLRRDLVCRLLREIPGVTFPVPGGAFYVFADVSSHYGRALSGGRIVRTSDEMAAFLLDEAGVAVVPGGTFGDDRCIRMSFAASAEDLTVALKRIARALSA